MTIFHEPHAYVPLSLPLRHLVALARLVDEADDAFMKDAKFSLEDRDAISEVFANLDDYLTVNVGSDWFGAE